MPTKWYWVMHGRLTRERKAYTSHRHSSITRPLPAARALKHQAPCPIHVHEHSTGSERVDALGLRAVEVIICMITRDFSVISNDVTGVSLSLSLSQKSLTHNIRSASALPIITHSRSLKNLTPSLAHKKCRNPKPCHLRSSL